MTNPTYEQALAIVRHQQDINTANWQGLELPIAGEITNLGGNNMALTFGTERGDYVVITGEAVGLYSNEHQFELDMEPNEYSCVYDIDIEDLNLSTPWWINSDADAIRALAECVKMNNHRLDHPEQYDAEASKLLTQAIEETCSYAMRQLDGGSATILEIF
jgi:hypothetical protein